MMIKNWLTKEFFINLLKTDVKKWNELTSEITKIDLRWVNLRAANLENANLENANLENANMAWVNLARANLENANLRGANLDFSTWPLWCGSFDVKVDKKIAAQLIYHICKLDCDDPAFLKVRNNKKLIAFANKFHKVAECGEIKKVK